MPFRRVAAPIYYRTPSRNWNNEPRSTHRSESPCHLLTRSLELTLKNVPFASVATAFARYDFPVPGGPYSRIPLHGVRFPVNKCGNLIGRMTASFNDSFAASSPATSSHFTFGLSATMALARPARSFLTSGSASSSSPFLRSCKVSCGDTRDDCGDALHTLSARPTISHAIRTHSPLRGLVLRLTYVFLQCLRACNVLFDLLANELFRLVVLLI